YPGASSDNAPAYCFVASVRDCPVKLLDASGGRLRASYPIIDHRERFIASHSRQFHLYLIIITTCITHTKNILRSEDAIENFDVQQPGEGDRLPTTPSKKSKHDLKGKTLISSVAFSSSYDYYAIGSLTPSSQAMDSILSTINQLSYLYEAEILIPDLSYPSQLNFNPTKPHILYAAFRQHN
ncbi:uncharacterized protein F5891DRAFT_962053, partial [Suillus fuscotomentosus]